MTGIPQVVLDKLSTAPKLCKHCWHRSGRAFYCSYGGASTFEFVCCWCSEKQSQKPLCRDTIPGHGPNYPLVRTACEYDLDIFHIPVADCYTPLSFPGE